MPHLAFYSSLYVVGPKAKIYKLKIWKIYCCLKGIVLEGVERSTFGRWRWVQMAGVGSHLRVGEGDLLWQVRWQNGSDPSCSVSGGG